MKQEKREVCNETRWLSALDTKAPSSSYPCDERDSRKSPRDHREGESKENAMESKNQSLSLGTFMILVLSCQIRRGGVKILPRKVISRGMYLGIRGKQIKGQRCRDVPRVSSLWQVDPQLKTARVDSAHSMNWHLSMND